MGTVIQLSRIAYSICIIAMGIHQLAYGEIDANFFPDILPHSAGFKFAASAWGVLFTFSGIAMLINWKGYQVSLISGAVFVVFFLFVYCPYFLFFTPKGHSLLEWAPAVECSAFAGASLIMAGSYSNDNGRSGFIRALAKLIPFGGLFFSIMLIVYGCDHLVYTKFVATMVPSWIPEHNFWTYFTGAALISAGVAIILKIQWRLAAALLGTMIFLWFLTIHVPTAMHDSHSNGGLELKRVFVSFGFTGICLLLALTGRKSPRAAIA